MKYKPQIQIKYEISKDILLIKINADHASSEADWRHWKWSTKIADNHRLQYKMDVLILRMFTAT